MAQELAHPYSVAYALYFAAVLHCLRREAPAAQARAEEVIALARQQELPGMVARGTVPRGWALAAQGQGTEGITQMCQGVDAQRTMGAEVERPYGLAILAEAYGRIGQTGEALRLLDEALALTHHSGGHFYQAEVHRLTGELLLMQDAGGGMSGSPPPDLSMIDEHEGEATGPSPRPTEAGNLVSPGPRHRPPAAGQIARAAGSDEPESAVAAAGPTHRRVPVAGPDLRLVHRGFRHRGPARRQGIA